ncbi:hypothetical protein [Leifsonia aquatica]|nr:hypothetical protein [Leifsonia aquatica]
MDFDDIDDSAYDAWLDEQADKYGLDPEPEYDRSAEMAWRE